MTVIKLAGFVGEAPRITPRLLPTTQHLRRMHNGPNGYATAHPERAPPCINGRSAAALVVATAGNGGPG